MEFLDYIISGVTLSAVSVIGLVGNLLLFLLIIKQVRPDSDSPAMHRCLYVLRLSTGPSITS